MKAFDYLGKDQIKEVVELVKRNPIRLFCGIIKNIQPSEFNNNKIDQSYYIVANLRFGIILRKKTFDSVIRELLKFSWFRSNVPLNMEIMFSELVEVSKQANELKKEDPQLFHEDMNEKNRFFDNIFSKNGGRLINTNILEELDKHPGIKSDVICVFEKPDFEFPIVIINEYVRFINNLEIDNEEIIYRHPGDNPISYVVVSERLFVMPTLKEGEK